MDNKQIAEDIDNFILNQFSDKEIIDEIDFTDVKQAAEKYLNILEEHKSWLNNLQIMLKRQADLRQQNRKEYAKLEEYIKNKTSIADIMKARASFDEIFSATFSFQIVLNHFLKQQVAMILVYDDGTEVQLYEITGTDLLSYDYTSKSQNLIGRFTRVNNETIKNLTKIKLEGVSFNFSLIGLKNTRLEVLNRYNIAKTHQYKKVKYKYVLWKEGDKWQKIKVISQGDIEEAYATFIFANQKSPSFDRDIETNVKAYLLQVNKVDNISGLLLGDTELQNFQIGIKSLKASTLSLIQVERLARKIVNGEMDAEGLNKLKDTLKDQSKSGKGARNQKITARLNKVDKEIIDNISKRLNYTQK